MGLKLKDRNKVKKPKKERSSARPRWMRPIMIGAILVLLIGMIAVMILARIEPDIAVLSAPETFIGRLVAPIQTAFANATDAVVDYLRRLKFRSNLELEYNSLKAKYDQTVNQAMLADQLEKELSDYKKMMGEMSLNESMQPVLGTVIGRDEGNYFSTFTINRGAQDGLEELMAVTVDGALVGYTYDVQPTTSKVRTIIDSSASIHCLIKSSRDQGSVKGTLGIDGTPMCRMYYLSDSLPRPGDTVVTSGMAMSFPKGIPVGTVRESTRGMDANKQYIVVEPLVDFAHIEYVIVYRYKPAPEPVVGRNEASDYTSYAVLETARPVPTLKAGADTLFPSASGTPAPAATGNPMVLEPVGTFFPSPNPAPGDEISLATPGAASSTPKTIEYQVPNSQGANATPSPTPKPTPTPTPTPEPTVDPRDLTIEDD